MRALASRRGRAYGGLVGSRLVAVLFDAHDPLRLAHCCPATAPSSASGSCSVRPRSSARAGCPCTSPARAHPSSSRHVSVRRRRRRRDVGQLPEEGHVVLADPEGNELCVIPAGNAFLDGCGFLGELAGEGTRTVGRFWSAALGWPLVWDEDGETAVQSPRGGTKLAWGGPPVAPVNTLSRQQHLVLAPDGEPAAEADRLVSIGATRVRTRRDGGTVLADPDGNMFLVWPAEPGF